MSLYPTGSAVVGWSYGLVPRLVLDPALARRSGTMGDPGGWRVVMLARFRLIVELPRSPRNMPNEPRLCNYYQSLQNLLFVS
jgi:hypothetical protein